MNDEPLDCKQGRKLQQRFWLAILYQGVGRGGKMKCQDFTKWVWNPTYKVLEIRWTGLKLLENFSITMVPHRNHFLGNFYHCLASFWAVEHGLFRSDGDERAIKIFLFPDLHSLNDMQLSARTCQRDAWLKLSDLYQKINSQRFNHSTLYSL